jgi:hypothetical protein
MQGILCHYISRRSTFCVAFVTLEKIDAHPFEAAAYICKVHGVYGRAILSIRLIEDPK